MSLSYLTRSTIHSSSFTTPFHHSKAKSRPSTIHVGKGVAYTSCEQKQNEGDNHSIIDRRNVLLGLGGLYGTSATVANQTMMAIAAPLNKLEGKQKWIDNVKFFWWKRKGEEITFPSPSAVVPPEIVVNHAEVSSELVVELPADEIWAVYSSPDLPRLIVELLPARFESIDILEGDGGEGTVLHCVLNPESSGPKVWNEKIIKIDHETHTKVVRQIEGGYLGIGFQSYEHIFKITPKEANSCVIRMTASYDVDEKSESNVSLIIPNWGMGRAIANYVVQKNAKNHSEAYGSQGT